MWERMRQYSARWAIAMFLVAPLMLFLVPLAHRVLFKLEGPHAHDSVWTDFLNMVGFYGGYVAAAATVGSGIHTWLVRRQPRLSRTAQVLWAIVIGMTVIGPQGLAFGPDYLAMNLIAGAAGGALFGLFTVKLGDRQV